MRIAFCGIILTIVLFSGCGRGNATKEKNLIIFHAGSLSVPVKKLAEEFEKSNPGVRVLTESAGSLECARKITELGKPCDIMLSSDYFVVDKMLIPAYASWNIKFATNEIVIAYLGKSKYSESINSSNWYEILLRPDVIFSRPDPNSDPCGYRCVFVSSLAGDYYQREGLTDSILSKDRKYIRPKEVDLVALLQTGVVDYIFQYKSVAIQHDLKYVELPKEINLSDINLKENYSKVSVLVPGSKPGSEVRIDGDYICYGGTITSNAPDKDLAIKFFDFMLSRKGLDIFLMSGQNPLIPALSDQPGNVPKPLVKYLGERIIQ
jgi:molybdate/tungstate transport system substrate-binding protein